MSTEDNVADLFTRPMKYATQFRKLRKMAMNLSE